jgi:hypothetical protein
MSYEGYVQYICTNGHYAVRDAYDDYDLDGENEWKCKVCGSGSAWSNCVDQTNGSFGDNGERIDGHVEPEVLQEFKCTCSCCGHVHQSAPTIYKIPVTHNDGPPFDAATATGMYDHDDTT